jgi:class 3 adenylate cyclase/tetratricopeptide (TPR) repeat protein
MVCPRCRAENREGRRFCGECGLSFASSCPSCGFLNEGSEKFCGGCGKSLTATAGPVEPRFSSPQTYTPKHLAEKILTSKSALEGERKQVTVLFADLKGSMELLADRDPEEARRILDPVLEQMIEAVHHYEGTVNQVMGDGIMALFGAPLAHEDHAVRACYAALRMQERVKKYAEGVLRTEGVTIQIRTGLNSGEVVVRSIASDLHMDYTAVGQTTHLAARMEQLAPPGSVFLTSETLHLAEGYVSVRSLGPVHAKGLREPVEVYEATGAGTVRTRLQASVGRGLSRFVGRDPEIEHLRRALAQAGDGRGQIIAVMGEPGVGKSRLFYEFTSSHRTQNWLILEAGSVSYGKATSYLPVIDLLKGYFRISDRDTHREIQERITGKILTLDRAFEPAIPALLSILDVSTDDRQWATFDPAHRRQRTLEAVRLLLLREAREQPLLVVFEDLHWIDSETQAFLDSLVDSLPTARLLLLVNYRPEYEHAWSKKTYYTQLRLDALPPQTSGELLEALLGPDASLDSLKPLLARRTGGNPLFLEESVRSLVETKALVGARGAYRLVESLATIQAPPTVQAILAARIDRLPAEDKRVLETAAVIGKDVPYPILERIADVSEEELRRSLVRLQAAELLYEARLFPDLEYTFKHALTHQVAYEGLVHHRRRSGHAQIVDAIQKLYPDRTAEYVPLLAHHSFRGELWGDAVAYSRQAGVRAFSRSANGEAVSYFRQALSALTHLPSTEDTCRIAVDVRLELRHPLFALGEQQAIFELLREAESVSRTLNDQARLGSVLTFLTNYWWFAANHAAALETAHQALAIADDLDDRGLRVTAYFRVGQVRHSIGQYLRALESLGTAAQLVETENPYERFSQPSPLMVTVAVWSAWALAEIGQFPDAIANGHKAVEAAQLVGDNYALAHGYFGLGYAYFRQGRLDDATAVLRRGVALCEAYDFPAFRLATAAELGYALCLGGSYEAGLPMLEHAVTQADLLRHLFSHTLWLIWLGEATLAAGRVGDARRLAKQALEASRSRQEQGCEAWVLRLLGDIAAHPEDLDSAGEAHYGAALTLASELAMRPLVAHCHLGLGKLYRRTGTREQAQEHLTTATTMYREMGMTYWLEKAEAEAAGEDVP